MRLSFGLVIGLLIVRYMFGRKNFKNFKPDLLERLREVGF